MKKAYKAIGITLAAGALAAGAAALTKKPSKPKAAPAPVLPRKNSSPFVFVHGLNGWGDAEGVNGILPYWGATCGDLTEFLGAKGYECLSASVGPVSSAWDRACELYAQLAGTVVDYGEAHSRAHNHKRFGRTYDKPLIEGWGRENPDGSIKKIHLIGHSFGGPTVRLLVHLLTYGCEEEVKAAGDSVSPLFKGGLGDCVESVTTLCSPHNSSSIYKMVKSFRLYDMLLYFSAIYCATLGRSGLNGNMVDFHLEQFGLTNTPGGKDADSYKKAVHRFLNNSEDTCEFDMLPENVDRFNKTVKLNPDVYYFSYAFDSTRKDRLTGLTMPILRSNPVIAPLGYWIAHQKEFTNEITGQLYDDEWRPNDLLCNTISEKYPFTDPHADFDGEGIPAKGIWNVMPVQKGDHGTAIGLFANKEEHRKFYLSLSEMLVKAEKRNNA